MNILSIPLSVTTVYLLPCNGGYLQVDSGYDRDYPLYRRGLEKAGIRVQEIKYLFLTHHHDDHAGLLNELDWDADPAIIAHEMSRELLAGGKNDTSRGGGYVNHFIKTVAGIKMAFDPHWTLSFEPFILRDYDLLVAGDDDQLLRRIGVPGRLLYTPGHCIDHLSLALDSGEVFCGDAASSFLLWAGLKYCTLFMTDMQATYRSWQKILDSGAKIIYPAHGRPFPASRLEENMGQIKDQQLVRFF